MADIPFVDTHVHFHDLSNSSLHYSWLLPEAPPHPELGNYDAFKSQRYWADDFVGETRFANVEKVVHVQAALGIDDPVEETRWLQEFADRIGVPHGIVAYANLADPDVGSLVERHRRYANLRGIRDLRYDDYLTDEAWERGYAQLERHGLVCCDDPLVEQMENAAALARRHPGIVYCVDHAGFPRRRDREYFEEWRRGMRSLAAVDNTVVKISGLGMCDHRWTVESIRPWVLECVDAWGVERAFFGTNWPVDRLFSSYTDVVDAYREIIDDFAPHEREALFSRNAERVFGL
jgi:predicted TIM-barrel fold metal-dependent hydrolase